MAEQYWITASDGNEYGPVPLETLLVWIRERRVVATTPVRRGAEPPVEAERIPEVASAFSASPAPSVPTTAPARAPASTGAAAAGTARTTALPAGFGAWDFVGRAWEIVKPHWLPLAGIFFVLTAIGAVPYLGSIVQLIIGGALWVGVWRAITGMIDGRPPEVGMLFQGFDRFKEAFLATLVISALIGVACAVLVLPGVVLHSKALLVLGFLAMSVPAMMLAIMWSFTIPFIAETDLGFWEAMRQSAELTEGYRVQLFLLMLANILVGLLGVVAFCVGIFVAYPVIVTSLALAYRFLREQKGMGAA
jgi:uncharacterized membrane protein